MCDGPSIAWYRNSRKGPEMYRFYARLTTITIVNKTLKDVTVDTSGSRWLETAGILFQPVNQFYALPEVVCMLRQPASFEGAGFMSGIGLLVCLSLAAGD